MKVRENTKTVKGATVERDITFEDLFLKVLVIKHTVDHEHLSRTPSFLYVVVG